MTKIGPDDLHIHCIYGIPLPDWTIAMQYDENRTAIVQFLGKYNGMKKGERNPAPALEDQVKEFGFWPRSHASWYLGATVNHVNTSNVYDIGIVANGHGLTASACISTWPAHMTSTA